MEAGLPDGVLQVVNGDKEAVDAILDNDTIMAVGFVGSTPIAQYIYARGCANGKRVQCFGGAKNHMIVMPDADMDQAADALVGAGYGAAGERCMAISVAVPVGDATADSADREARSRGSRSSRSAPTPPATTWISARSSPAPRRSASWASSTSGVEQGAELVVDGRGFQLQGYENGFFVGPHPLRPRHPRHGHLQAGDLRPRADHRPRQDLRRGAEAGHGPRIRQRHRDLHPRRRHRARLREPGQRRDGRASTCRSRCRWPTTPSAAGRNRASAT